MSEASDRYGVVPYCLDFRIDMKRMKVVSSNTSGSVHHGLWTEVKERVDYCEEESRKSDRNVGRVGVRLRIP